jgi:hypothetical protein
MATKFCLQQLWAGNPHIHDKRCYATAIWPWITSNFSNILWQDKAKNSPLLKFKFANILVMAVVPFISFVRKFVLLFSAYYIWFSIEFSTICRIFSRSWIAKIATFSCLYPHCSDKFCLLSVLVSNILAEMLERI